MSKNSVVIRSSNTDTSTFSNSGSIYENEYGYVRDSDNIKQLVLIGKKNVYEIIQSHKDDTNIYNIINRVMNGDYSVLDSNQGKSIDSFKMPKSLNEYNQFLQDCVDKFNTLDPKVKALFKNSYDNFAHCIENGTLNNVLSQLRINNSILNNDIKKEKEDIENEEVKTYEKK